MPDTLPYRVYNEGFLPGSIILLTCLFACLLYAIDHTNGRLVQKVQQLHKVYQRVLEMPKSAHALTYVTKPCFYMHITFDSAACKL